MLRLIPETVRLSSTKSRRKSPVVSIHQTDTPLEIRRVLSAVSAGVDYLDQLDTVEADSSDGEQTVTVSQRAVTARIVNGQSTDQYDAVGIVNGGCTGTLIAPDVVLTAAHCVESNSGGVMGDREGTFEVNGQVYKTTKITVHPNYNANNFGAGYDIAIMKLDRPVDGVTPYDINRDVPQVGQMLTLVGFGETGTSTSGSNGDFGNKTVGQTAIDEVTQTHISWNFDSHNESNTAPGDSGGPAFVEANGKLVVAGITSGGNGDAHQLGDFSFDTRVDTLAGWIDQVAGTSDNNGNDNDGDDSDDDTGGDNNGDSGTGTTGTFTSTAAVSIPDDQVATVTSTATSSGLAGNITDVNVSLDIDHTWNEDLTVTLVSPSGIRIELFDAVGGDSQNFTETVLDEQSGMLIENGFAPFKGSFRPFESLDLLNGEDPNGVWTLEVRDNFELDGGQINSFAVTITTDGSSNGDGNNNDTNPDDGDQGDIAQLALQLDEQLGLGTSGNYFENWGGKNEKWMTSSNGWVFITPDGSLYEWNGQGANGALLATLSADYHESPELLHQAYDNFVLESSTGSEIEQIAIQIDQQYDLRTTGDLWEDWAGMGEKWLYSNVGWMFITPDGSLYEAAGNDDGSDKLIYTFTSEYHADPSKLYNAADNAARQRDRDDLFAQLAEGADQSLCSL